LAAENSGKHLRLALVGAIVDELSRDNLDENGGGNQSLKRRPVAKS